MKKDLFDLKGRVAIVTGGAGILGPRHAEALAAHGAKVVIVDRDLKASRSTAKKIGRGAIGLAANLTLEVDVRAMVQAVLKKFRRIDVLINNAAAKSENFFEPFEKFPLEDWNQVMASNVTSAMLCAREVGGWMAKHGGGSIVNIASIYGIVGPDQRIYDGSKYLGRAINTPAVYSASKAAILGLTRHLATYWGKKGVRVNSVTPGGVQSGQNSTFVRNYSGRVPMGRMAKSDELQGAIVYLASDASQYVTGHNLVVDGGLTVW